MSFSFLSPGYIPRTCDNSFSRNDMKYKHTTQHINGWHHYFLFFSEQPQYGAVWTPSGARSTRYTCPMDSTRCPSMSTTRTRSVETTSLGRSSWLGIWSQGLLKVRSWKLKGYHVDEFVIPVCPLLYRWWWQIHQHSHFITSSAIIIEAEQLCNWLL